MSEPTWSARRFVMIGLITFGVLFGGFGTWAAIAQLGGAIIASGRLEVEQNRQVIQHPFGGEVEEVLVREGDMVNEGDLLIRLDARELESELTIIEGQLYEIVARRGRLEAERDGADAITFDEMLTANEDPRIDQFMRGQQTLFEARIESINAQVEQLERRTQQIEDQIRGLNAQQESVDTQLELIQRELADQKSLLERGLSQSNRVLSLEREQANLIGRRGELAASVAQAEGRITEIELAILNIATTRREEAITELRAIQPTEIQLKERQQTLNNRLDRLDVRANVSGVVFGLEVFSDSAVIRAAEPLMYLVPQDRSLIITARIRTNDIEQIQLGQEVMLRFSAFDQRQTPELYGSILNVSGDAFEDQATGLTYYRTEISLNDGEVTKLPEGSVLIPGMPVEAYIKTGERSPLDYLLKPATDFFMRSFRES